MARHRFYVAPGVFDGSTATLDGTLAHRIGRVLRLSPGDCISLFDGTGREAMAEIGAVTRDAVSVRIGDVTYPATEPQAQVTLCQALLPGERFEWVLEKGTELGVARFVPLVTARGTAKPPAGGELARKSERWHAIVRSAAEQCGRVKLPEVDAPRSVSETMAGATGPCLLAWEGGGEPLQRRLSSLSGRSAMLLVGPEGGFTADEVAAARSAGAHVVTLGPRILRSETAGIALAAVVLYALGELG